MREDVESFDYLKEELGYRLADRVLDITKEMDFCLDIGSGRGYVTRHLTGRSIKKLKCCEMSTTMLEQCVLPDENENIECEKINYDEDNRALPFEDESINIVTSSLSLHWVNNLPGLFKEVNRVLKKVKALKYFDNLDYTTHRVRKSASFLASPWATGTLGLWYTYIGMIYAHF